MFTSICLCFCECVYDGVCLDIGDPPSLAYAFFSDG